MISLEHSRKTYPVFEGLSDEESIGILEDHYALITLALESFIKNRRGSKNPVGVQVVDETL